MSDHKLLHQTAVAAESETSVMGPAAAAPHAPVPLPVAARGPAELADLHAPTDAAPPTIHRLFGKGGPPPLVRQGRVGPGADTSTSMSARPAAGPPPLTRQNGFRGPKPINPHIDPHAGGQLDNLANYEIPVSERKPKDDGSAPDMYDGAPIGKFSNEPMASKRERVAALKAAEPAKDKAPHQPTDDLGESYAHIAMIEAEYKHQVGAISKATVGKADFRPGGKLKGLDRAFEKAGADYQGDLSRMVDLSGASISYATPEALVAAYGAVRDWEKTGSKGIQFNVVRVKNSLVKGKSYGDINLSIEMGGSVKEEHAGYIFELQLHLAPIIGAKTAAHHQYEGMRKIEARNKKAGLGDGKSKTGWAAQDEAEYKSLEDEMNAMYGEAWVQVGPWAGVKQVVEQIEPFNPKK